MEVDENKRIVLNEDAGGAVDEDDGDDDDDGDGDRKGEEDDAKMGLQIRILRKMRILKGGRRRTWTA